MGYGAVSHESLGFGAKKQSHEAHLERERLHQEVLSEYHRINEQIKGGRGEANGLVTPPLNYNPVEEDLPASMSGIPMRYNGPKAQTPMVMGSKNFDFATYDPESQQAYQRLQHQFKGDWRKE